jgi:hypothetical protein
VKKDQHDRDTIEARLRASEERFRLAQMAGGIGTFDLDLRSNAWEWTPQTAALFGFDFRAPKPSFADWEQAIFIDDVPKVRAAIDAAQESGIYHAEFRVRYPTAASTG